MLHDDAARSSGATLAEVVRDLELELVLGRIKPRERLIEDELMPRFGAKRHVIRSALMELERRGLVQRRQNKGAWVREFSGDEVRALYDFRAGLHEMAVARLAMPLPAQVLADLVAAADAHEAARAANDLREVIDCNNRFHDILFDECGNAFLADTIRRMAAATNAIRSYRIGDPDLLQLAAQEHRQMIDAAWRGDRDALSGLCRQHIVPSRDLYLRDQTARIAAAGTPTTASPGGKSSIANSPRTS